MPVRNEIQTATVGLSTLPLHTSGSIKCLNYNANIATERINVDNIEELSPQCNPTENVPPIRAGRQGGTDSRFKVYNLLE